MSPKKSLFFLFLLTVFTLQFCTSAKKATVFQEPVKLVRITFDGHIKLLIVSKCAPCHLDIGNEVSYDNYASAKENINDIIRRIKLTPEQHGFMPQKAAKLSDSTIKVFEQWKIDSLLER